MLPTAPRWTLLPAGALAAVLTVSGCSGDATSTTTQPVEKKVQEQAKQAPSPAKTLPAPVQSLVAGTDVGEFLVTPKEGTSKATLDGAVARLKTLAGVQSAELTPEGKVDLVFKPSVTGAQRAAAVKQLAALGEVEEGI